MEKFVLGIFGRLAFFVGSWVGFTNHTEPILLPSYHLSNTNLQVNYGPDNIGMQLIKKLCIHHVSESLHLHFFRKPVYAVEISGRFDVGGLDTYIKCHEYFLKAK